MLQSLKIEWLKIKRFATFWIMAGLFAVLLPLFNYQFSSGMSEAGKLFSIGYEFPNVYGIFGFWASWFTLFIAFLVIITLTNEYRYRTSRQHIIDGWTRMQFFHAKCSLVVVLALLTTLYVALWCFIFGYAYSDNGFGHAAEHLEKLGYFFLLCLNYYGFAAMLSFLLKRSGLTMGLFMLYALIIENILNVYLNWQFPDRYIGTYLPLQASDELLPFSAVKQMMNMINRNSFAPEAHTYAWATCIYIALYYFISRWRLSRSDW